MSASQPVVVSHPQYSTSRLVTEVRPTPTVTNYVVEKPVSVVAARPVPVSVPVSVPVVSKQVV